MGTRTVIRVVVASPSDVAPERHHLQSVIDNLNRGMAPDHGLAIELWLWEADARPGFHPEGPQGAINRILRIDECDLLIGIFWTRIGTPSRAMQGLTGTQHEINSAIQAWKSKRKPEIMLYFNQDAAPPKQSKQVHQVLEYRESLPEEAFCWEYTGPDDFKEKIREHIERFIRDNYPLAGLETQHAALASLRENRGVYVAKPTDDRGDRMFPALPFAEFNEEILKKLGAAMTAEIREEIPEGQHDGEENTGISAGYTYLGQFIYNDLTFDPGSTQSHTDPARGCYEL